MTHHINKLIPHKHPNDPFIRRYQRLAHEAAERARGLLCESTENVESRWLTEYWQLESAFCSRMARTVMFEGEVPK